MDAKVALLIVYNHRFDKNIDKLETLYAGRFSHIFHVIPFYDGDKENVLPVYESSWYFSGYIAQAYQHIRKRGFSHYFIVADDMILNPAINEESLFEEIGINKDECMLPTNPILFSEKHLFWSRVTQALDYKVKGKGCEIASIIPAKEEAMAILKSKGLDVPSGAINVNWKHTNCYVNGDTDYSHRLGNWRRYLAFLLRSRRRRTLPYPLIAGYSDIFLVTENAMPRFAQYCGAFAASQLFVEIAIPTSLFLAADKIRYGSQLRMKDGSLWDKAQISLLASDYNYSLGALINGFKRNVMYIHPVKLSQWRD